MTGIPRVRVSGTAHERGLQYGEQARARVHRSVEAYREVFAHYAGWDWDTVRREAARFEAPVAAFGHRYLEEMRGIADGAGLGLADVLAINVRTEIMFAATVRKAAAGHPGECSTFAVIPASGATGPVLLGQNWDWLLHAADTVVILEASQDDGPGFVTVVEAGLLAKTGMNTAGLGLVTNALVSSADVGEPGVPYHVLLRALLDCTTVTGALTRLQNCVRSSSANYLIAHSSGAVLNVEAAPGDFSRLYPLSPGHDGVLLHTNHFLAPGADPDGVSAWAMPDTLVRLQRLRASAAVGSRTLDGFRASLADHADYPFGVCSHPDQAAHPQEQSATITSVLMDLTEGQMWLAAGNPCAEPYELLWRAA